MFERNEQIGFARHSKRADGSLGYGASEHERPSEKYPSLTIEGEEKARELAKGDFAEMLENSAKDAILFIGGSSEEDRTKATAEIIGDELAKKYRDDETVVILSKSDIENIRENVKDKSSVLQEIQKLIDSNKDKKLVFTFPLFLKEFSLRPHHREKETGEHTPYMKELLETTADADGQYQELEAAKEWFRNEGKIEKDGETLQVPSPQKTAENHIVGINRLKKFAKKFAGDREINIGFVGHGWQLDALAVYLANEGKVNSESFEKLFGSEIMEQPESGRVEISENKATFFYRGRKYKTPDELLR